MHSPVSRVTNARLSVASLSPASVIVQLVGSRLIARGVNVLPPDPASTGAGACAPASSPPGGAWSALPLPMRAELAKHFLTSKHEPSSSPLPTRSSEYSGSVFGSTYASTHSPSTQVCSGLGQFGAKVNGS
jgi:hypothetical protein